MHVHHGHLPILEQLLDLGDGHAGHVGIQTDEAGDEIYTRGRQVHDVVAEDARLDERLEWLGLVLWRVRARELGLGHDVDGVLCCEQFVRGSTDEVDAVRVEGTHIVADLVEFDVVGQAVVALRVQVVGPHEATLFACRHGERTHARGHVADGLALLENIAYALVLGVQTRVPVDLGKVELESAALLVYFDVEVVFADEHLVLKRTESVLAPDIVYLVDDGLHHGVLVGENGCDQVLVGPVALAQVEVGDMAGQREALRDLVVILLLGWGDGRAGDLRVREVVVVEVQLERDDAEGSVLLEVAQLRAPCCSICLSFRLSTSGRCLGQQAYRRGQSQASRRGTCRPSVLSPHRGRVGPAVRGCWAACPC